MVRFGEVVRNVNDNEREPLKKGLKRYIGLDHIDPEDLHLNRWGLIEDGTSFTRKFVEGQVLFGKRRAYQRKVAHAEFDGICSGDILVFESKDDELLPELLPFIAQSDGFFEKALGTSAGSLSPRTKWKDLAQYEFPLPPKDEQRRIAEILLAAENAIRKWETTIDTHKRMKDSFVLELLSCGLSENGELRDPLSQPHIFKDSPLGHIPKNWEVSSLGLIASKDGGVIQTGPFGSQLHAYEYVSDGVPVMMPQDLIDGQVVLDRIAMVSLKKANLLKRHQVQPGDIVLARRGDLERCAHITEREAGFLCGTGCLLIRPPSHRIDSRWFSIIYRNKITQRQVLSRAVGTTMVNLNTNLLKSLVVAFPPVSEQREIANVIESHNVSLCAEYSHQQTLKLLQKYLMADLLAVAK